MSENDTKEETTFMIRRSKVLKALKWLVEYNEIYKAYVTIDKSNLDWMGNAEEKELNVTIQGDDNQTNQEKL